MPASPPPSSQTTLLTAAINDYCHSRQDLTSLIGKYTQKDDESDIEKVGDLDLNKDIIDEKDNMPVHPVQDQGGDLTDKIAKESNDSTASSHNLHSEAHKANPGPVVAENIGKPESKEELKKRSEELNK